MIHFLAKVQGSTFFLALTLPEKKAGFLLRIGVAGEYCEVTGGLL